MNDVDKPATKADIENALKDLRVFVLDREAALIWKVVALQMTLIGAITLAQWLAFSSQLTHVQNQLNQLLQHLLK
jgi:hypothetical protein